MLQTTAVSRLVASIAQTEAEIQQLKQDIKTYAKLEDDSFEQVKKNPSENNKLVFGRAAIRHRNFRQELSAKEQRVNDDMQSKREAEMREREAEMRERLRWLGDPRTHMKNKITPLFQKDLDFVETEEFNIIHKSLLQLVKHTPSTDIHTREYVLNFGALGMGKTDTVWYAIKRVVGEMASEKAITPCYLRVSTIRSCNHNLENEEDCSAMLATVLLFIFAFDRYPHGAFTLRQVSELALDYYKTKYFILHIDGMHNSLDMTRKLVHACFDTMRSSEYGIHVIPIVSSINNLKFDSLLPRRDVRMGAFPTGSLWASFARKIGLPLGTKLGDFKHVSILFNSCGNYAYQVGRLIQDLEKVQKGPLTEDLDVSKAMLVFKGMLYSTGCLYGVARWNSVLYGPNDRRYSNQHSSLIKRVMRVIFTEARIDLLQGEISPGVPWERCRMSGMLDYEQVSETWWVVKCCKYSLFAMNKLAGVIPEEECLEHAFEENWRMQDHADMVKALKEL